MVVSDKHAERRKSQVPWGCGVAVVLAGLVFLAGILLGGVWYTAMNWAALVAALILVAGILGATVVYAWYSHRDLDDRKVATLRSLASVLRADVPASDRMRVTIDFRSYRKG